VQNSKQNFNSGILIHKLAIILLMKIIGIELNLIRTEKSSASGRSAWKRVATEAGRRHLPLERELTIAVRRVRKMAPPSLLDPRRRPPFRRATRATTATPTPRRRGRERGGVASAPDRTAAGRSTTDNPSISNIRRLKRKQQNQHQIINNWKNYFNGHRTKNKNHKTFFFEFFKFSR
jgi:hypothetical protein